MTRSRRWWLAALAGTVLLAAGIGFWPRHAGGNYLPEVDPAFAAQFATPPARGSPAERAELDQLLELQRTRTPAEVDAARADRKTEISRFFPALGFPQDSAVRLPRLEKLAQDVEDDIRPYVRVAKDHFRRLRPYVVEPRLEPCIDNVAADLSYPSGHAAFGYSMAYMLADLLPERRAQIIARGDEFARQRLVCGVHFPSDLEAGRQAAALLIGRMRDNPAFRHDEAGAAAEVRAALQAPTPGTG